MAKPILPNTAKQVFHLPGCRCSVSDTESFRSPGCEEWTTIVSKAIQQEVADIWLEAVKTGWQAASTTLSNSLIGNPLSWNLPRRIRNKNPYRDERKGSKR